MTPTSRCWFTLAQTVMPQPYSSAISMTGRPL